MLSQRDDEGRNRGDIIHPVEEGSSIFGHYRGDWWWNLSVEGLNSKYPLIQL